MRKNMKREKVSQLSICQILEQIRFADTLEIHLEFTSRIKATKYFYRRICEKTTMLIRKVKEKALDVVKLCA